MTTCGYCHISGFASSSAVRSHQKQTTCREKIEAALGTSLDNLETRRRKRRRLGSPTPAVSVFPSEDEQSMLETPFEHEQNVTHASDSIEADPGLGALDQDAVAPTPVADRPAEKRARWTEDPEEDLYAGATYGPGKTAFEIIHDEEILKGGVVLGPFRDDDEWQLAKWLIKHVGHTATEEFLNLSIVSCARSFLGCIRLTLIQISERASPSYTRKKDFFEKIDSLPGGVKWQCRTLDTKGDLPDLDKDPTGATMKSERLDLWWRDPVECVAELIGNPAFKDAMRYAPQKLYADKEGEVEVIDEMWTASWWWEIQVSGHIGV